jgi:ribosomal-protein-alanine acetyltransferase
MSIRMMDIDDIEDVVMLEEQIFTSSWTAKDFLYELLENQYAYYFVYEKDHVVAGYIGIWKMYEQVQITTVGVDQTYQRQGIGKALMNEVISFASQNGCEVMSLEVRISNEKAIALYENLGFCKEARRKNYYQDNHEDAYLMVKRLEEGK